MSSFWQRGMETLRGSFSLSLMTINTLLHALPIYVLAVIKLLPGSSRWKDSTRSFSGKIAESWIGVNNTILSRYRNLHWEIQLPADLNPNQNYFVNSNHQSWVDILVLQRVFNRRIPFMRFFLKQQLIWVPLLGAAWWALDFPFMRRYSKSQLAADPKLKEKDLETTQKMCDRLSGVPISIMNFLEGTRLSPDKQRQQDSPFTHLLKPKAGGLAFTLTTLRDQIQRMLDVSIVYPEGQPSLWDLLSGKLQHIVIDVRTVTIPDWLTQGNYQEDSAYRERLQQWVNELWRSKDELICELKAERSARFELT